MPPGLSSGQTTVGYLLTGPEVAGTIGGGGNFWACGSRDRLICGCLDSRRLLGGVPYLSLAVPETLVCSPYSLQPCRSLGLQRTVACRKPEPPDGPAGLVCRRRIDQRGRPDAAGGGGRYSLPSRPATSTVTRLTALQISGRTDGAVTLVANETAANGTHPAGWVQFAADGTDIGAPVSLNAGGVATTHAAFSAGESAALSAAFTPMSTASAATDAEALASTDGGAGAIPVSVTVPVAGSFAVTITPGTVTLAVHGAARNTTPVATGMLLGVTVTEDRNYLPGWSLTGQASNLTAAGQPVSGTHLGWIPVGTVAGGAKLGAPVAPGDRGLGSAGAVLAVAAPGSGMGTATLSAELMLAVPPGAHGGPFAGTLTITFLETGPLSSGAGLPSTR
jgi:hypothetical protein